MKLNRGILLALTIALCAVMTVSSTLAYLTSTDSDVNVMTLGSVKIKQIEQEWNDDKSALQAFTQGKPLMPYTGELGWVDNEGNPVNKNSDPDKQAYRRFTMNNVVDKYVSVENTGKSDAYVRTIIALEMGGFTYDELAKWIGVSSNSASGAEFPNMHWQWTDDYVAEIDGKNYNIMVAVHDEKLAPGATTVPSLLQVYLSKDADNAEVQKIDGNANGTYDILVVSQAVQADGFEDPITALNTGFGKADESNKAQVASWFGGMTNTTPDTSVQPIVLQEGKTQRLTGKQPALSVSGSGLLVLDNVTISNENDAGLTVVEGSDVTLTISGSTTVEGATGKSGIEVAKGATLTINGGGSLTAIGNGGVETMTDNEPCGHGIGGEGDIVITGLDSLTAKGYGEGGFGIGGNVDSVTISDTTIKTVKGGQPVSTFDISTDKYGKSQLEGGAAIGSGKNGAVITLDNVVIEEAIGGSKSAAIGARYWHGVTINISNSTIKKAVGGTSSAGIGGSRVSSSPSQDEAITINIHNSTVNATGGTYAAGIGSGYDTHCPTPPVVAGMCTINITGNSVITAQGGTYAAGIGTGYHNGQLSGKIESTVTVNAASGDKLYKNTYTQAQDVGFGVVDPAREGLNNTCTFDYKGTTVVLPSVN